MMKEKDLNAKHVFSKNNQVFIKKSSLFSLKKEERDSNEDWSLINFQWISIVKLQEKFKV